MMIFNSDSRGPLLLDSLDAIAKLERRIVSFLRSEQTLLSLPSEMPTTKGPYGKMLGGIRIEKLNGPAMLEIAKDDWLVLTGSASNLESFLLAMRFDQDEEGAHHHTELSVFKHGQVAENSMHLVIEADTALIEELRS